MLDFVNRFHREFVRVGRRRDGHEKSVPARKATVLPRISRNNGFVLGREGIPKIIGAAVKCLQISGTIVALFYSMN